MLVTSCTSALEIAALLCDFKPGDEVILPSYTFVSTANAFLRAGAKPIFVDIDEESMNLQPAEVAKAVTPSTRAIVPVHYAGNPCDMDAIMNIAEQSKSIVIEDAAQAVNAYFHGKALGSIGHLGTFSFHDTKNFVCGEGGALCINDKRFIDRAEIIREKGTNRKQFMQGVVDKYTWVDTGSSYIISELNSAFLYGQLESMNSIGEARKSRWNRYHSELRELACKNLLKQPNSFQEASPNWHMYQIVLPTQNIRDGLMRHLREQGIHAVFHYVPLHTSPMGKQLGYAEGMLPSTEFIASRILRLPLYGDLQVTEQNRVIQAIEEYLTTTSPKG